MGGIVGSVVKIGTNIIGSKKAKKASKAAQAAEVAAQNAAKVENTRTQRMIRGTSGNVFDGKLASIDAEQSNIRNQARSTFDTGRAATMANSSARRGLLDATRAQDDAQIGSTYGDIRTRANATYGDVEKNLAGYADAGRLGLSKITDGINDGSLTRSFGASDFNADPGYQFRLEQGAKLRERAAAKMGTALSGGQIKGMEEYGQNAASDEYDRAYDRFNTDRANTYNKYTDLVGLGQYASEGLRSAMTSRDNTLNGAADHELSDRIGLSKAYQSGMDGILTDDLSMERSDIGGYGATMAGSYANYGQDYRQSLADWEASINGSYGNEDAVTRQMLLGIGESQGIGARERGAIAAKKWDNIGKEGAAMSDQIGKTLGSLF